MIDISEPLAKKGRNLKALYTSQQRQFEPAIHNLVHKAQVEIAKYVNWNLLRPTGSSNMSQNSALEVHSFKLGSLATL
jgi:hypothetical protein